MTSADNLSVFALTGAPASVPVYADATATQTTIQVSVDADQVIGYGKYMQVGSELVRLITYETFLPSPAPNITVRVAAADTTLTLDDTGIFRVNPTFGATQGLDILGPNNISAETVTVTEVLSATQVKVVRTAAVIHELRTGGTPIPTAFNGESWRVNVERGALGTTAVSHPAWRTAVVASFRPADFVRPSELEPKPFRLTATYSGGGTTELARFFTPFRFWSDAGGNGGGHVTGRSVVPLPVGANVRLAASGSTNGVMYLGLSRVANATGDPVAAGAEFGALGTMTAGETLIDPTQSSAASVDLRVKADNSGVEVLTAGWFSVYGEVSYRP